MCSALQQTHAHQAVCLHSATAGAAAPIAAAVATAVLTDRPIAEKALSTVVPNMPSPQTPDVCDEETKCKLFPKSRKGKLALFVDLFILICVVLIIILIEFGVLPHHQSGFYCDDPKISFKYEGETVSMGVLLTSVYVGPLILIILVELRDSKRLSLDLMRRLWFWYKEFLLGMTVTLVITEIAKIVIGEPRPHFLDTCQPDTAVNCTPGYIPYYMCTNTQTRSWFVRDSSKSFPSGHASLSVFSAIFSVWYLQRCLLVLSCKLVKPLIQTALLVGCTTCSLSRIADHRHHWWDVLAGAVLGFLCALYTVVVFCKNFKRPLLSKPRPSHSTCTLLTDTTNKHATSVVL